jgi:hypothetical protein
MPLRGKVKVDEKVAKTKRMANESIVIKWCDKTIEYTRNLYSYKGLDFCFIK